MFRIALAAAVVTSLASAAAAQTQAESDVVRLPGQGELKLPTEAEGILQRLVPGGGLILSFDTDRDGVITPDEVATGIDHAFNEADANGNGSLTALEQQDWANSLPTRDESLANPVRFDPNLDRTVSLEEFTQVISNLAAGYADPDTGRIDVEDLHDDTPREAPRMGRDALIERINAQRN